jgi:RNA polymerase sigma-70 factor (ECF subfamily)
MDANELRWVLEAVGGDRESFGRLVELHSPAVVGLVYSLTGDLELARDVTQEAMLKAWTSLATLRRPDRFGSWVRQIAANLARSHQRQAVRRPVTPLEDQEAAEGGTPVAETVERRLARQEILRTLQLVPEGPRAAVVLHYLVGLAPADAARHLGISRAAFDTRLSRGRDALRRELARFMDEALSETKDQVTVYLAGIAERVKAALQEERRERVSAAKELALLAARANLPRLLRDLRGHDMTIRKATAQLVADTLDRRAATALVEALQAEDEAPVQAELCRALAKVGVTEAIPHLQKLARNTADMTVHKAADEAAKALTALEGQGPDPGTDDIPVAIDDLKAGGIEDLFLALLDDESPAVRVQAIDGLGRVESVKAVPKLTDLLSADPAEYVRRAAAEALGAILWPGRTSKDRITATVRAKAVRALADALADPTMTVPAEAAWSLSLINPGDIPDLRQYVMDRAYPALETLLQKPGPWWATIPAMLGALGTEADRIRIAQILLRPGLRWPGPLTEALVRMSRHGVYEANPLIGEAILKGSDARCTHRLVAALGATQDPVALPLLEDCLRPAPSTPHLATAKVREEAAKALAGYPQGRNRLRQAAEAWLAPAPGGAAAPDDSPVAVIAAALATLQDPADVAYLDSLADRLSPRTRISVRAAARRITTASR